MNNSNMINGELYVPDEVKPFEMAARIYMKKIGADPNTHIPQPHPTIANVFVKVPAWCFAAQELIDLSMKLTSIREANLPEIVRAQ